MPSAQQKVCAHATASDSHCLLQSNHHHCGHDGHARSPTVTSSHNTRTTAAAATRTPAITSKHQKCTCARTCMRAPQAVALATVTAVSATRNGRPKLQRPRFISTVPIIAPPPPATRFAPFSHRLKSETLLVIQHAPHACAAPPQLHGPVPTIRHMLTLFSLPQSPPLVSVHATAKHLCQAQQCPHPRRGSPRFSHGMPRRSKPVRPLDRRAGVMLLTLIHTGAAEHALGPLPGRVYSARTQHALSTQHGTCPCLKRLPKTHARHRSNGRAVNAWAAHAWSV